MFKRYELRLEWLLEETIGLANPVRTLPHLIYEDASTS